MRSQFSFGNIILKHEHIEHNIIKPVQIMPSKPKKRQIRYIPMYIYIHIHTYIHTYIHISLFLSIVYMYERERERPATIPSQTSPLDPETSPLLPNDHQLSSTCIIIKYILYHLSSLVFSITN